MARSFDGVDDLISGSTSPASGQPLTLACWLYPADTTVNWSALTLLNSSDGSAAWIALVGSTQNIRVGVRNSAGSFAFATTTTTATPNVWTHACGVFASNTSRAAFINGGNKGTNTTSRALSTLDSMRIGCRGTSTTDIEFFPGLIAEAGVWNVALSDADVARLAQGFSPRLIRPQSLVFYAPLIRDIQDIRGAISLTNTGSTVADHPRIYP